MTTLPPGHEMFARYAFPPNELGYCGPGDASRLPDGAMAADLAQRAREFTGAWPYLRTIADAAGADPLDPEVNAAYWVGGPLLEKVAPDALLARLRAAFAGQRTGLLGELAGPAGVLAHHSFHVFVVYPWIQFLDRDPTTPLQVMQDCRIRWGTVESVDGDYATITASRLTYRDGRLGLDEPHEERIRWAKDGESLSARPVAGEIVSAHWDWACGTLRADEVEALAEATRTTLELVNAARARETVHSSPGRSTLEIQRPAETRQSATGGQA